MQSLTMVSHYKIRRKELLRRKRLDPKHWQGEEEEQPDILDSTQMLKEKHDNGSKPI